MKIRGRELGLGSGKVSISTITTTVVPTRTGRRVVGMGAGTAKVIAVKGAAGKGKEAVVKIVKEPGVRVTPKVSRGVTPEPSHVHALGVEAPDKEAFVEEEGLTSPW